MITIGGLVGYSSRGLDTENLTWDRQWDPNISAFTGGPNGEPQSFDRFGFVETSLGINFRRQKTSRTKFDIGVGAFHLTQPTASFTSIGTETLPIRLSFYGIFSKELTDKLDLQLDGLYQRQRSYDELLFGGYLNFYLNQNRGKEFQFRVGAGYRTRKAIYPKVGLEFRNIFIAASYDIYLTDLAEDHGGGGPELHIRYIIKHVKPLRNFKSCPIF